MGFMLWTMTTLLAWYGISKVLLTFPPTRLFSSLLPSFSRSISSSSSSSPSSRITFRTSSIAHRGGSGENVENTMRAFAHAVHHSKVDMLELDVHLTADGHVVVFHDVNLWRLTGHNKKIRNLTLSQLPSLLPSPSSSHITFDSLPSSSASSTTMTRTTTTTTRHFYDDEQEEVEGAGRERSIGRKDEKWSNTKIPTLEEVFQAFPSTPINLDIKVHSLELISKVHSLILAYNRQHLIIWGSFNEETVSQLRRLDSQIPTFFSLKKSMLLVLCFHLGLLPFIPLSDDAFEAAMVDENFAIRLLGHFGYAFYPGSSWLRDAVWGVLVKMLVRGLMNPSFFSHLQKRGVRVIFWTINSVTGFDMAFRLFNADGIITDNPHSTSQMVE